MVVCVCLFVTILIIFSGDKLMGDRLDFHGTTTKISAHLFFEIHSSKNLNNTPRYDRLRWGPQDLNLVPPAPFQLAGRLCRAFVLLLGPPGVHLLLLLQDPSTRLEEFAHNFRLYVLKRILQTKLTCISSRVNCQQTLSWFSLSNLETPANYIFVLNWK